MAELDFVRVVRSRREAERVSGLSFSIWVGESDEDSRTQAERLHAALQRPDRSVYVLCNVRQRTLEVVTGSGARQTLSDSECEDATDTMRELLSTGDVTEALELGLEHLASYALD